MCEVYDPQQGAEKLLKKIEQRFRAKINASLCDLDNIHAGEAFDSSVNEIMHEEFGTKLDTDPVDGPGWNYEEFPLKTPKASYQDPEHTSYQSYASALRQEKMQEKAVHEGVIDAIEAHGQVVPMQEIQEIAGVGSHIIKQMLLEEKIVAWVQPPAFVLLTTPHFAPPVNRNAKRVSTSELHKHL